MSKRKKICYRVRRAWRNFWKVTPKEWVRVQIFCGAIATSIGVAWGQILQVFDNENSDEVRTIMVAILAISATIAAYAQTKTTPPKPAKKRRKSP